MQIIALRKGGSPCSKDCPFYSDSGWVDGINGPLKTHCRGTMETVIVDCDVWNPNHIEKLEVTEEQWKAMQNAIHKKARRVIKPFPKDHEEIHPVGWNWKHQRGKWNADKSNIIKH